MPQTFRQMIGRVMDQPHRPKNMDETEVKALINLAYIHVVAELGCYQKSVVKALTPNDGDYSIVTDFAVSDFAAVRSLVYTAASGLSTYSTLAPTTEDEVLALRSNNSSATSPAVCYALQGWDGLMLHPLPAAGDTLTILYSANPAEMSVDADTPDRLPVMWQHLIVSYAAATAMEVVSVPMAMQMMEAFENGELKRARRWFNNHYGSRPFAPGGFGQFARWPSDYWSGM